MSDEMIDNAIRQNAQGPASAEVDGTRVTQQSLPDLIEADKHLGRKAAGRNLARALTRVKIVHPGAV